MAPSVRMPDVVSTVHICTCHTRWCPGIIHIPTDFVVAQEASDVESSSRLDFLLLHNLRRRFIA